MWSHRITTAVNPVHQVPQPKEAWQCSVLLCRASVLVGFPPFNIFSHPMALLSFDLPPTPDSLLEEAFPVRDKNNQKQQRETLLLYRIKGKKKGTSSGSQQGGIFKLHIHSYLKYLTDPTTVHTNFLQCLLQPIPFSDSVSCSQYLFLTVPSVANIFF